MKASFDTTHDIGECFARVTVEVILTSDVRPDQVTGKHVSMMCLEAFDALLEDGTDAFVEVKGHNLVTKNNPDSIFTAEIPIQMAKTAIVSASVNGLSPAVPGRHRHANTDWKYSIATNNWQLNVLIAETRHFPSSRGE